MTEFKNSTKQKAAKNKAKPSGGTSSGLQPSTTHEEMSEALKALEKKGVVAALRGQKEGIADLLQSTDHALSIKLAVVYAAGLVVASDDDQWDALCEAEEWSDHPKLKPKRNDALRAVLRLAVGFDGKKADSSVHRYYKALSPLFDDKVPAVQIPDRIIEAGGIEKMRQAAARLIDVVGDPQILRVLYEVAKTTTFKARIKVEPLQGNRCEVEIFTAKQSKKK